MLFASTDDIRSFIPVNVSMEFETLSPYIDIAEDEYLTKLIGSAMFDVLAGYLDVVPTEKQKKLLRLAKKAVINLALWRWSNVGSVQVSDMGITRQETTNQKSAYKYQEEALREGFKQDGFNGLDTMLEYMEENINDFLTFKQSSYYTIFKGHLINQTKEFDDIYFIGKSRLVFLRLQRFIIQAEDFHIIPSIGIDTYNELMAILQYQGSGSGSGEGTSHQLQLISLMRKACAHLAVYMGIAELNVNITDKGLFFESKDGGQSSFQKQTNVNETFNMNESLASVARAAYKNGMGYLEAGREYLLANLSQFSTYQNSLAYDSGDGTSEYRFDNTDKKIVRM